MAPEGSISRRAAHIAQGDDMKRFLLAAAIVLLVAGALQAQGKRFREFPDTSPKAGEKAPDFSGVNEEGKKVALSQLKGGKHVVLIFGAIT